MKKRLVTWMLCGVMAPASLLAQAGEAGAPDQAIHDELRALREQLVAALNAGDIDKAIACCHPEVVITWQNAEVGRGHKGVKDAIDKLMTGPNPLVKSYKPEVTVDETAKLFGGDTAVAAGKSIDRYELTNGTKLELYDRWTAVVVNQAGKWQIAALHVSANAFDNPVLAKAKSVAYWTGGGGLAAGLLLGLLLGRRRT
ncbi:MAG: nuclear transport factor 2 family protein [Planctomycetes bacterium]|nr:nuclear transport factor 2 family protein [Planctomycetota bacterium]